VERVSLDTIAGGAIGELFSEELMRVLANITDPNTDAKTSRKITIEVSFAPNEDRDETGVKVKCSSKLAGIKTVETRLFVGYSGGELTAVENNPKQSGLFDQEETRKLAAVASIGARGGE